MDNHQQTAKFHASIMIKLLQQRNNKEKSHQGATEQILALPDNLPIKVCLESMNNNAWATP